MTNSGNIIGFYDTFELYDIRTPNMESFNQFERLKAWKTPGEKLSFSFRLFYFWILISTEIDFKTSQILHYKITANFAKQYFNHA